MSTLSVHDQVNHRTDAGTLRFNVPIGNGTALANITLSANSTIGNLTQLVGAMALGNAVNTTNGTIVIYDGTPTAANQIFTLTGNAATQLRDVYLDVKAPVKNGGIVIVRGANCPAAWFSVISGGPNGQPGNQT